LYSTIRARARSFARQSNISDIIKSVGGALAESSNTPDCCVVLGRENSRPRVGAGTVGGNSRIAPDQLFCMGGVLRTGRLFGVGFPTQFGHHAEARAGLGPSGGWSRHRKFRPPGQPPGFSGSKSRFLRVRARLSHRPPPYGLFESPPGRIGLARPGYPIQPGSARRHTINVGYRGTSRVRNGRAVHQPP